MGKCIRGSWWETPYRHRASLKYRLPHRKRWNQCFLKSVLAGQCTAVPWHRNRSQENDARSHYLLQASLSLSNHHPKTPSLKTTAISDFFWSADDWAALLCWLHWARSDDNVLLESHWGLGVGVGCGGGRLASPPPGGYTHPPRSLLRAALRRAMWKLPVHGRPRPRTSVTSLLLQSPGQSKSWNQPSLTEWGSRLYLFVGAAAENVCHIPSTTRSQRIQNHPTFSLGEQKEVSQGNGCPDPVLSCGGKLRPSLPSWPGMNLLRLRGPGAPSCRKNPVRDNRSVCPESYCWYPCFSHLAAYWNSREILKNIDVCLGPVPQNYNFTGIEYGLGIGDF